MTVTDLVEELQHLQGLGLGQTPVWIMTGCSGFMPATASLEFVDCAASIFDQKVVLLKENP